MEKQEQMKNLLIILMLVVAVNATSQDWKRGLAIAGYHVGCVAIGAIADGCMDNGNKQWGHALQVAELGAVAAGPFIFKLHRSDVLSYILSYGFIRLSLFDSFYNMTRDLPLLYNGTTSKYDEFMNTIPDHGKAWIKSWSLVVGFAIPINEL